MFYLIIDNKVVDKSKDKFPVSPSFEWVESSDLTIENGFLYSNNQFIKPKDEIIKTYKMLRAENYPSLGDQLDMLWHSMDTGEIPKSAAFYDAIKAVKDKYPKGGV